MSSNYHDIKEYLLGGLGPDEREGIELRVIEDGDFAEEALAAEDALIESYVDGELAEADAARFRAEYLTTDERVRRVKDFVALRAAVVQSERSSNSVVADKASPFLAFFTRLGPALALGAAAVVLIAVAGFWFYFSGNSLTDLEQQYASLNKADMTDLSRFPSHSKVELIPGTFRSVDAGSKIATGGLSETVLFRLPLGFEPSPDASFKAEVWRDGKGIFSVAEVRAVRDATGHEVRVLLPRSIFGKGQYQIRLSQDGANNAPVVFNFIAD
jgi:hypothetical protein